MGLGYGSEFQLMRFLGHHREYLNSLIRDQAKIDGPIEWKDYPADDTNLSGDREYVGIECFKELENYAVIKHNWKKFWPGQGNSMNWDGIFTSGDEWFFVEAKAHKSESFQKCTASSKESRDTISRAFKSTQEELLKIENIESDWITTNCYQLANRLAFIHFCRDNNIKARLIYIGFIKGFRRKQDEVQSAKEWMDIWTEELNTLGLNMEIVSPYLSFVHPDCENPE